MLDNVSEIRKLAHQKLLAESNPSDELDRTAVASVVASIAPLVDRETFDRVTDEVMADVNGFGSLDALMADPAVTDVMVVGGRGVWVERRGEVVESDRKLSDEEIARLIERIVAPLGLRVDRASPMVDARLPDGSRVNAVVAPLAVDGPCLTIRRFGATHIPLEHLASSPVAAILVEAVKARMNILVSGGTGSGKTTLLNALCHHLDESERVITVEDSAELRLPIKHVVRLEGRPENSEGVGAVSLRDLVRNALRMRPDRIVVGEIRGPEALDMLQAMNTGHEGSMSTCHANGGAEALRRVETMVMMGSVALPFAAVRQQITSSIDLVVHIERSVGGARRVTSVSEVVDINGVPEARAIADANCILSNPQRTSRRVYL